MLKELIVGAVILHGSDLWTGAPQKIENGKAGAVVVFMSARCPCSNSHVGALKKLIGEFPDFHFVVVHSNANETKSETQSYFKNIDLPLTVLQDEGFKLADQFRANKTPHAFVLNREGKVVYRGGVTDSSDAPLAKNTPLRDALVDLQAGKNIRVPESRTLGCAISRGEKYVW